jgi:hypothetical protein
MISIRGGKTRGLKRPHFALRQMIGDGSQSQDMRTPLALQSGYRPILPHEQDYFQFDNPMDVAIVMGQPDPYRP